MTRRMRQSDNDEGPSDEDIEQFSGVTRTCPKCDAEMFDDVEICWKCGHSLMTRDSGRSPRWVPIVAALVIIGFLMLTLRGC